MDSKNIDNRQDIAIIGMACRLPGAPDIQAFWANLCRGEESVTFFSDEELLADGIDQALILDPSYVKAGTLLPDHDRFDAAFFGITPRDAALMGPQQRIMLECACEALENAGYSAAAYRREIGVYAGGGMDSYLINNLLPNRELFDSVGAFQLLIDNSNSFLSTRVSYKLNLTGPSINVQTACSTSLVAVHLACQGLLAGECSMALAGGVSVQVPQRQGYLHQTGMIHSPDGHTRTFDAEARGTIGGNGAALVVLKRFADARADGDTIYALIKGSAINNDGALKVGYAAPSVDGQAKVIRQAQAAAGVDSETIQYVEAHGTATTLGDPIEIAALTQAFATKRRASCAIGSVKTNIGHADAAAGVAGLIKTALSLKHGVIPPSLHFVRPNPAIDFANSPFYVNTKLSLWPSNGTPRRAGVSSFGVGGTNAHVILEEAPALEVSGACKPWHLLVLSAKTSTALDQASANLAAYLEQQPDVSLADVAYTLAVGRERHKRRRVVLCQTGGEAVERLRKPAAGNLPEDSSEVSEPSVVFMFPGQGAQYVNMGRDLYVSEPIFREQVDHCSEILLPLLRLDLRSVLYPSSEAGDEASQQLEQTALMQPAIFVISYATAELWGSWGVTPQAMIGHSLGEYVAATLAGVFTLEAALALVATRGRLMQSTPEGAMLAVSLPEAALRQRLHRRNGSSETLALAAVNGPAACAVSGRLSAIQEFEEQLNADGISFRRLHVRVANHSDVVDPILAAFTTEVSGVARHAPEIPFTSNVTGGWITDEMAADQSYWARHLRQTVRFSDGLQTVLEEPNLLLLEVGPGRSLSALARQQSGSTNPVVLNSLRHPRDSQSDCAHLFAVLGQFWMSGGAIHWDGFYAGQRRHRIPLPTYPFERQRYWIDPPTSSEIRSVDPGKKQPIKEWLYVPSWERSAVPFRQELAQTRPCNWLIFADECGLAEELSKRLAAEGNVVTVRPGVQFARLSERSYLLDPGSRHGYITLLEELASEGVYPQRIVHLWRVSATGLDLTPADTEFGLQKGFYSLLYLSQAIQSTSHVDSVREIQLIVVTNNMQEVSGDEPLHLEKATVLGPVKVIPQELPNVRCRSIDLLLDKEGISHAPVIDQLLNDIRLDTTSESGALQQVIAYRGKHRWEQTFKPLHLGPTTPAALSADGLLRQGGVYLITGGLGGIGLVLAEALASLHPKLVLVGRSAFPERREWEGWLAAHDESDPASRKIRKLQAIERAGAEVLAVTADVSDRKQMQAVLQRTEQMFGPPNGLIHAAGITKESFRLVHAIRPDECAYQFSPKISGLLVLHELLQGKSLDFCILLSSLASVLGGLGLVAYSAANLFMDSFATMQNRLGATRWISVNLDGWQTDSATLARQNTGPTPVGFGAGLTGLAMTNSEGVSIFQLLTTRFNGSQVAVSTGSLSARITQWCNVEQQTGDAPQAKQTAPAQTRPASRRNYVEPSTGLERQIAEIWQELLGIEEVGVSDDFWELGADSLLGLQLISRLSRNFQVAPTLETLFQEPTISGLASYIETSQRASQWQPDSIEIEIEEGVL